jgi:hypothetical protein
MRLINWDAILSIIEDLTGVPTIWDGDSEPMINPDKGLLIKLNVPTMKGVGWDEDRVQYFDPPAVSAPRRIESTHGLRDFTVSVLCSALPSGTGDPYDCLEALRIDIQGKASRARLRGDEIALRELGATATLDGNVDGRDITVAQLDLKFYGTVEGTQDTQSGWIESVTYRGEVDPGSKVIPDTTVPDP